MNFDLAEAGNLNTFDRVLSEVEDIIPEHDKVLDILVVDL